MSFDIAGSLYYKGPLGDCIIPDRRTGVTGNPQEVWP